MREISRSVSEALWQFILVTGLAAGVLLALIAFAPRAHADTRPGRIGEDTIYIGCAYKAELVFDAAQEKLYNHGNVDKLMAYMENGLSQAEFAVQRKHLRMIGEWVDNHEDKTAHDYAAAFFALCVENSYTYYGIEQTEKAREYMARFAEQLEAVEERLLPSDVSSEVEI